MKLNKILFAFAVSSAALLASCVSEPTVTPQISTENAEYTIPAEGGSVSIKLLATERWEASVAPSTSLDNVRGIVVTPDHGAGSDEPVTVTVTAGPNTGYNRSALVSFVGPRFKGGATIKQEGPEGERVMVVSCKEFTQKDDDNSIFYQVTGTVTKITDENYNDFYINDGSMEGDGLYVYGLYESKGAARIYHFMEQMDIREGDILTMGAYKTTYNGTIEAAGAYYISHEKSKTPSIKLDLDSYTVGSGGETFDLAVSSNVVTWTLTSDKDWLTFEPATGNASTTVKVTAAAGSPDTATITLSAEGLEPVTCTVERAAFKTVSIADALAGGKIAQVEGTVSAICTQGYVITDASGSALVYYGKSYDKTYKVGDKLQIVATPSLYNFGPQFGVPTSETVLGSGEFTYPSPKLLDAATCDQYIAAIDGKTGTVDKVVDMVYSKLIGTLSVSGSYYNVIIDGTDKAQGSIYNATPEIVEKLKALDGKKIEIRGMFSSISGKKYINLVVTSVEEYKEDTTVYDKISEVAASTDKEKEYNVKGTVAAVYARGALITDGTGYILYYKNADSGYAIGDIVTVKGVISAYGGFNQFTNTAVSEKVGTDTGFKQPEPVVLDGAAADALVAKCEVKYIQYKGKLAISGNYYNVTIPGAGTAIGSLQYPTNVDSSLNGKDIVATGYSVGVSSGKYLNTMVVSCTEDGAGSGSGEEVKVFINEIDCGNKKIELYNAGSKDVDIAGFVLDRNNGVSDYDASKDKWTVPAGKGVIPAGGFVVYTAKSSSAADGPMFGVSGTKGFIIKLLDKDGKEIDKIENRTIAEEKALVEIADGETYGRKSDGGDSWTLFSTGSIGESNAKGTVKTGGNVAKGIANIAAQIAGGTSSAQKDYTVEVTNAVVSYVNGNNAFIEDATGAILYYKSGHGLAAGDVLNGTISGKGYEYNGLPEIVSLEGATKTTGGTIPLTTVTIADLIGSNAASYISRRVIIKNVNVKTGCKGSSTTSERKGTLEQGGNEIQVFAQLKNTLELATGAKGDLICYPTVNNGTKQVGFWDNADFTASSAPVEIANVKFNEVDCQNKKIEIYNAGSKAVDIAGYVLTKDDKDQWTVPAGMGAIPAGGFVVYTAKSATDAEGPTFGVSGTKGFDLKIAAPDGTAVDHVDNLTSIVTVEDGETYGRKTDGAAEWVIFSKGTIGASNAGGTVKGAETGALEVVLSGATKPCSDFPEGSTGVNVTTKYTIGGYEYTFAPSSDAKFSWYTDKYILMGKQGAYILLPAIEGKKLTKVVFMTTGGCSEKTTVGIYSEDGSTVVTGGEDQKHVKNTEFTYNLTGTEAGKHYQWRVTNANNAQFQWMKMYYE